MTNKNIDFKEWASLSFKEQKQIYDSWDRYKGEGEQVIKDACSLFEQKFGGSDDIMEISYGLYHGDDWVISVTLRVGHKLEIPNRFYNIIVIKLYGGLTNLLKSQLIEMYANNIEKFVDSEVQEFSKYFDFANLSSAKKWLIEFVEKYKDK